MPITCSVTTTSDFVQQLDGSMTLDAMVCIFQDEQDYVFWLHFYSWQEQDWSWSDIQLEDLRWEILQKNMLIC